MYNDQTPPPQYSMMSSVVSADKRTSRHVTLGLVAGMFALAGIITVISLLQGGQPKELQSAPVSLVTTEPEGHDTNGGSSGTVAHIYVGALGSDPDTVTITPGTTVVWRNNDSIAHNISGDEMGSDHILQPGESLMFVYAQPGDYSFIDNGLAGTITVKE